MINDKDNIKILNYYKNINNPSPETKIGRWNRKMIKSSLLTKKELENYMEKTNVKNRSRLITAEGKIGTGKTSIIQLLHKRYGGHYMPESVDDNPVLEDYYKDPQRFGYLLQTYFLGTRLADLMETYKHDLNLSDRSVWADELFFHINYQNGNATKTEYEVYQMLLNNFMTEWSTIPKRPELLIYIDLSFEEEMRRIKKRGRSFEQPDEENGLEDYYKQLYIGYEKWIEDYEKDKLSPVLRIDGDKYDFVENMEHRQKVLDMIDDKCLELGIISKEVYNKVHGKNTL